MNKLKKPVSLLLTLLLLLSVAAVAPVSFSAGAVDEYTEGNYKYTVSNNKATITKYIGHAAKVVIPSTLGGYPVTCLSSTEDSGDNTTGAFYSSRGMTSVTIPSSVKTIGYYTFQNCFELTDITIHEGLESIYKNAFSHCRITQITLPKSLKRVYTDAFVPFGEAGEKYGIKNLTLYTDGSSNFDFGSITNTLESVTFAYGSTIIPDGIFGPNYYGSFRYLNSVSIPNTVTWIGESAFRINGTDVGYMAPQLTYIDIPPSVQFIGKQAFYGHRGLEEVTLHKGLLSIGEEAFYGCDDLEHIILPRTLQSIGKFAFSGCDSLTGIDIPGSVSTISEGTFASCDNLSMVVIHKGCTGIEKDAFARTGGWLYDYWSAPIPDDDYAPTTMNIFIPMSVMSIKESCYAVCTKKIESAYSNDFFIQDYYHTSRGFVIHAPNASIGKSYAKNNEPEEIPYAEVNADDDIFKDYKDEDDLDAEADGSTPLADMQAVLGIVGGSEALLGYVGDNLNVELNSLLDDGSTLKRIGKEAFKNLDIESIGLPNSVENIDEWAFHGCKELGRATLNAGLKEIGHYAFQNCSKLTDINLPDSLTEIGAGAFSQCKKLTDIELPSNLTNLWNGAFEYCSGLESIDIPDGVKVIGNGAFLGTALQDVQLPDSITTLARGAFEECKDLQSINIPSNIRNLGSSMFSNCNSLTSVNLSGLTTIGDKAFSACKSLEDINFPDELKNINDSSFTDCINLEDYELPDGITSLGNAAFGGCETLRNIELPDSITSVGAAAFENCWNLQNIELPSGITSIGDYTFSNCENLKSIEIPDGVTSIGEGAFKSCKSLSKISLPNGVTTIGDYSFSDIENLKIVEIPEGVTYIHSRAFEDSNYVTLYGYENSYAEEYANSHNIPFVAHTVSNNKATVTKYNLARMSQTDVVIHSEFKGNTVTALGDNLFKNCTSVDSVTLPDTLKTIGESAFEGCSNLTSVSVPKGAQSIGASAFASCAKLKKAYIWGRTTAIGTEAFEDSEDVTIYAYDSSPADDYAANDDVPFVPLLKTNKGDSYEDVPLTDTQSVENDGNGFGLNMGNYGNSEFLGVQIKNDHDTKDIRFVSVLNEGIVSEATKSHDVDDYGFVVAKSSKHSTASMGEGDIQAVSVDNPKALAVSCKMTSNKICGDYGVYNFNTKYKYVTLAINDVPDDQGFVVRSYVKMKSGRVYYANYNLGYHYTGCVTSYGQLTSIDRGENSVLIRDDWNSLNTFADE